MALAQVSAVGGAALELPLDYLFCARECSCAGVPERAICAVLGPAAIAIRAVLDLA